MREFNLGEKEVVQLKMNQDSISIHKIRTWFNKKET